MKPQDMPRPENYPGPDLADPPCLTCTQFSPTLTLEGMGYCELHGWQSARRRPRPCGDHSGGESLRGLLRALRAALEDNWRARGSGYDLFFELTVAIGSNLRARHGKG